MKKIVIRLSFSAVKRSIKQFARGLHSRKDHFIELIMLNLSEAVVTFSDEFSNFSAVVFEVVRGSTEIGPKLIRSSFDENFIIAKVYEELFVSLSPFSLPAFVALSAGH
jgi:hypothetical protein